MFKFHIVLSSSFATKGLASVLQRSENVVGGIALIIYIWFTNRSLFLLYSSKFCLLCWTNYIQTHLNIKSLLLLTFLFVCIISVSQDGDVVQSCIQPPHAKSECVDRVTSHSPLLQSPRAPALLLPNIPGLLSFSPPCYFREPFF